MSATRQLQVGVSDTPLIWPHRNLTCEHIMQKWAQERTDALADLADLKHALQSNSDCVCLH